MKKIDEIMNEIRSLKMEEKSIILSRICIRIFRL